MTYFLYQQDIGLQDVSSKLNKIFNTQLVDKIYAINHSNTKTCQTELVLNLLTLHGREKSPRSTVMKKQGLLILRTTFVLMPNFITKSRCLWIMFVWQVNKKTISLIVTKFNVMKKCRCWHQSEILRGSW